MNKLRVKFFLLSLAIVLILTLAACSKTINSVRDNQLSLNSAREYDVLEMPLPDDLASPSFEYSGLGWYGDTLVLLPQYPNRNASGQTGLLYGITKDDLIKWKIDQSQELDFFDIPFDDAGLSRSLPAFEGFEAILFLDHDVYLTIETSAGNPMKSYLVRGSVSSDGEGRLAIRLDKDQIIELPQQNQSSNASYEALTSDGEFIYALYEQNGQSANEHPYTLKIDQELLAIEKIPVEPINYRISDVSQRNENGEFWGVNYFFPGDEHLKVEVDPISDLYGLPGSHEFDGRVERLVKFLLNSEGVEIFDQAPVYLELSASGESRNWEGLVVLDKNSFVIVTDKFPGSMLAMVIIE